MQNKTAVITGATSGIGAAFAREYARQGYDLVITGRRKEKIESVAEQIRQEYGTKVDVLLAELSDKDGVRNVIDHIKGRQIEVLINNAGFGTVSPYQESDLAVAEQLAYVNVMAPMELIHAALPGMVERGRGTIINISSLGAFLTIPQNAVYSGAKAFLKSFTEGLHLDLFGTGVRVMAVCPGFTHTDFHEKIGVDKSRQQNNGGIKWIEPEKVVDSAMKDLAKGKVISISDSYTKMLIRLMSLMPRKSYYKIMYNLLRKGSEKRAE